MASDLPAVAVIGAGNVGCALAADLVVRGCEVRLWNRSEPRLEEIRRAKGVTATGAVEGFAPLDRLSTSFGDTVRGAQVVAVALPTPALPSLAVPLAELTTADQLIWLDPGHSGGALFVAAELERRGGRKGRLIGQLSTSSHGARLSGPASVNVFSAPRVRLASFPGTGVDECLERLEPLLPGRCSGADSVLELDLANGNAVMHPPLMVCNAGWIEATGGRFPAYRDGTGAAVARLMEAVDAERRALAGRIGVPCTPLVELLLEAGYTSPAAAASGRVHDALHRSEVLAGVQAPPTLDHRYLHEDVGWGLVPWVELGRHVGVATPTMAALATVAGALNGTDYFRHGLTLGRMGLDRADPASLLEFARTG